MAAIREQVQPMTTQTDPFACVRGVSTGPPRIWPLEPLTRLVKLSPVPRHELLTDEESDRLAIGAGFHPLQVWPDWHA